MNSASLARSEAVYTPQSIVEECLQERERGPWQLAGSPENIFDMLAHEQPSKIRFLCQGHVLCLLPWARKT